MKLCVNLAIVVYLTFCQQYANFFGDESLYNFYSFQICQCKILDASSPLLANYSYTHILKCESLAGCFRVVCELIASHMHATCEHLSPCGWAVPYYNNY